MLAARRWWRWVAVLWTIGLSLPAEDDAARLRPLELRCEYLVDPSGIDVAQPRLTWALASSRRAEVQTAWQILAASSPEALARDQGDLWDSGKVAGKQTLHVPYAGAALGSGQRVWWNRQGLGPHRHAR